MVGNFGLKLGIQLPFSEWRDFGKKKLRSIYVRSWKISLREGTEMWYHKRSTNGIWEVDLKILNRSHRKDRFHSNLPKVR